MKKENILKILKDLLIILFISILAETIIFVYQLGINGIYKKMHFTNNESIKIEKSDIKIKEDKDSYFLNVNFKQAKKIYNVSLVLNDKNQDVYMRVLFNNDAKFIPKENANASKFKVYFLSGIESEEISITYPKSQLEIGKIKEIIINDNLDYMPKINFSIGQTAIIFISIIFMYLLIKIYKYCKKKETNLKKEYVFLGLSLTIGLILVFINVPQIRYDEHAHFWRTYEISRGNIISKTTNKLPVSIIDLFKTQDGNYPNRNFDYKDLREKIKDKLNKEDEIEFPVGATGSLTPISYLPQVIGVELGKILNLSPIMILWLGRITNLLAYVALIFIAIRIMPSERWKKIIMIIALFPMSLNLAATLSPDTVILAFTLLAISYTMHLKYKVEKIELKQIALLGILFMIPTVCKIVYFPICLLVLLLPKEKFENKAKHILAYIITLITVFVPYILLNKIVKLGDYAIAIRSNMMEQCLFTASDIVRDFGTAINTMYSEFSTYFFEMIGGWNTIELISIFIFMILLFEMFDESKEKEYQFMKKEKIVIWIICIIEILGVIAAMYLGWTQAKQTVVEGVQGRYFLPTIPLICLVLSKNKIKSKIKNKDIKYIIANVILYIIIFGYSIKSYL